MAHPRCFFFRRFSFPASFTSTPFTATGSDFLETAVSPTLRRGRRHCRVLGLGGPFRLRLPWKQTLASVSYPGGQGTKNRFAAKIFWNWDLAAVRRFAKRTEVSPAKRTHVRAPWWNRGAINIARLLPPIFPASNASPPVSGYAASLRSPAYLRSLRAPARAPATHAPIAASIPRHDAAAEAAGWRVTQIHDARQRIGRVDRTRLQASGFRLQVRRSTQVVGL